MKIGFNVIFVMSIATMSESDHCNIPRVSVKKFRNPFSLPTLPTVFVDTPDKNKMLIDLVARENLLRVFGDQIVTTSSSNSYSQGRVQMKLADYIVNHVGRRETVRQSNESCYLFGDNYDGAFREMEKLYIRPNCIGCAKAGANSFGIAGEDSGVSFHFHGPGFSEALIGRKRWFLFDPYENVSNSNDATSFIDSLVSTVPGYHPNLTVSEWTQLVYPSLKISRGVGADATMSVADVGLVPGFFECTIGPGEALFFPANWMHATLNVDPYNVFVSVFIDPQLLET